MAVQINPTAENKAALFTPNYQLSVINYPLKYCGNFGKKQTQNKPLDIG